MKKERRTRTDAAYLILTFFMAVASGVAMVSGTEANAALLVLASIGLVTSVVGLLKSHRQMFTFGNIGNFVFNLGMVFWFYGPAFGTALSTNQWDKRAAAISSNNGHAVKAFLMISLFHLAYAFAYQWRPTLRTQNGTLRFFGNDLKIRPRTIFFLCVFGAMLGIGFYVYESGGVGAAIRYALLSRSGEKPWSSEGLYGTSITPFHYVAQSLLVVVSIVGLTLVFMKKVRGAMRVAAFAISGMSGIWVAVDSGTRSTFILAIVPALLLYYALSREKGKGGGRRSLQLLSVVMVLLVVVVVADIQRGYRASGNLEEPVAVRVQDNDFFSFTTYAMAVQERENKYTGDSIVMNLISGPVPRAIWPNKPYPESIVVFSLYVWGVDITEVGGNTLPSIVGQKYLSQGPRGVIEVGLILGLILALGDSIFRRSSLTAKVVYSTLLLYIFVSFRTMSFGYFTVFELMVAAVLVFQFLTRKQRVRRTAPEVGSPVPVGLSLQR